MSISRSFVLHVVCFGSILGGLAILDTVVNADKSLLVQIVRLFN